jgi:23S rRNA (guanosine2251-2'-O)-methyltransferase
MGKRENIILGWHPLMEAIEAGTEIEKVWFLKDGDAKRAQTLKGLLQEKNIPLQFVPPIQLDKYGKTHQGVVARISQFEYTDENEFLDSLEEGKDYAVLLADKITDVRNLGAICRSIECFGAHALLIPDKEVASLNEFAVKSSAGALLKIPIIRSNNIKVTFQNFMANDFTSVACTEKGHDIDKDTFKYDRNLIILGAEDKGISPYFLQMSGALARIPLVGTTQSLNVSVAAGIILHEWRKSVSEK